MKLFYPIIFIAVFFLSGCTSSLSQQPYVVVHDNVPVLSKPDRPILEILTPEEVAAFKAVPQTLQDKLLKNDKSIKIWAEQLSVTVDDYNAYAKQHNIVAQQWVNDINVKGK